MNIIILIVVILLVTVIGGGIGLLFYYKTRPKKQTWTAYVWAIGEGIKEINKDSEGNVINKFKLKDLIPKQKDVLVKINKAHKVVVYKLSHLGHTTQQPSEDAVDVWGNGERVVNILLIGNNATILKKGYDTELGEIIFRPMPRELLEMVISEAQIAKNDLEEETGFLQKALPWIGVGMTVLMIVAVAYFNAQGYIEASKNHQAGMDKMTETIQKVTDEFRNDLKGIRETLPKNTENNIYGKQSTNLTNKEEPIETIK